MFKDIDIFIAAAQAIWAGKDPYQLAGVEAFYPLPFYLLFLPLAWLPLPIVHVLWGAISGVVLIAMLKRRALAVIFSTQALLTFLLGQVDIVMMGLYVLVQSGASGGGIALAFMALKPQLVFVLAPFQLWRWWRTPRQRRELVWFFGIGAALTVASFIAQPNWVMSLLGRSGERVRANVSSSLWGLLSFLPTPVWLVTAGLITVVLIVWAWRTGKVEIVAAVGLLVSPLIFAYNLMPLYAMFRRGRILLAMAALSWVGLAIANLQSNDRADALVAVFAVTVLFWQWWREPRSVSHSSRTGELK